MMDHAKSTAMMQQLLSLLYIMPYRGSCHILGLVLLAVFSFTPAYGILERPTETPIHHLCS